MGAGVSPGLQNQCGALGASWVGSIPTCPRQKERFLGESLKKDKEKSCCIVFGETVRWLFFFDVNPLGQNTYR